MTTKTVTIFSVEYDTNGNAYESVRYEEVSDDITEEEWSHFGLEEFSKGYNEGPGLYFGKKIIYERSEANTD